MYFFGNFYSYAYEKVYRLLSVHPDEFSQATSLCNSGSGVPRAIPILPSGHCSCTRDDHCPTSYHNWLVHLLMDLNEMLEWIFISSVAQSCPALCDPVDCSTPGFPVHHELLELTQTHACWVGDAIQPSHPLSSPSPLVVSLSQHQVFSIESVLHIRWPKYWSFSFSISPSNEYSGLISFRIDWFDLLAVQGTLKSLL